MGYGLEIRIPGVRYNTKTTGFPYRLGTQPNELTIQKNIPYMGNKIQMKSSIQPLYTSNNEVDWQILDGSTYCSIDGSTGELTIDSSTITQMVKLRAQSRSNPSIFEEKEVVLTYKELPEILDVQYEITVSDLLSEYNYTSDDTSYTFTAQLNPVAAGEDIVFDIIEGSGFVILNNANFDNNISTFNISFLDPGEINNIKFRFYVYSCPDLYRDVEVTLYPKVRNILFRNIDQEPYLPDTSYSFDYYTEPVLTNRTLDVSVIQGYNLISDVSKYNENGTTGTVSFTRRNIDINQDEEIIFKLKDTVNVDVSSNLSFIFSPIGEHRITVSNNKPVYDYTDGQTYEYFTWEETPEYSRELTVSVIEGSDLISWNLSNVSNGSGRFNFIVSLSEYGGNVKIRISDPNNPAFYKDVQFMIKGSVGLALTIQGYSNGIGHIYGHENTYYMPNNNTDNPSERYIQEADHRCLNVSTNEFNTKTVIYPWRLSYTKGVNIEGYDYKYENIKDINIPIQLCIKSSNDIYKDYDNGVNSSLATDTFDIDVSTNYSFNNSLLNDNFEALFYTKKAILPITSSRPYEATTKQLYCRIHKYPTLYIASNGYHNDYNSTHYKHASNYRTRELLMEHYRIRFITFDGDVIYSYFDPYNQHVIDFFSDKNYNEIVCEEVNRIEISAQDDTAYSGENHSVDPSPINLDFTTYFSRDYTVRVGMSYTQDSGQRRWFKSIFKAPELISLYQHLLTNEIQDIGYFVCPPVPESEYIDFDWPNPNDHYQRFPKVTFVNTTEPYSVYQIMPKSGYQLYDVYIRMIGSTSGNVEIQYLNLTFNKIYPGIAFTGLDYPSSSNSYCWIPGVSDISIGDHIDMTINAKANDNSNLTCKVNWRLDFMPEIYKPWIDEVDYDPLASKENYLRYIEYIYYKWDYYDYIDGGGVPESYMTPEPEEWEMNEFIKNYVNWNLIPYYNLFDSNDVRKQVIEDVYGQPPFSGE